MHSLKSPSIILHSTSSLSLLRSAVACLSIDRVNVVSKLSNVITCLQCGAFAAAVQFQVTYFPRLACNRTDAATLATVTDA